ncbi:non-structural maintenance of chromosomes element 4 homolog A [Brienomyrus brachyistius]|uniref:non-structural maintenance of chromosomes element 4 homolog A n=1 Tax=Brienomyrus brachyistius TaxID=42636 RepID=UPI0020B19585|nr:non-structural maintenance of chromosomes element 4 homolog A [Brienomyrus brachyistius]XP_048865379.1 non-structural maintenance of chromosomes element 4 homolog A [Brienomyrus brachyistius]
MSESSRSASRQNGVRGNGGDSEEEDDEEMLLGGPSATQEDDDEDDNDPAQRRQIRHQYRELINSVQQNREDMLSPSNNRLTEVLEEANRLFANVRQAREAALDAQFLVLATDLGKEKANQLHADGSAFDPSAFAEHLLSFMGLNRLEEDDSMEDAAGGGYLPEDAWLRLAQRAESCFRKAPTFHFMLGSFLAEPPPPRQRVERQRKAPNQEVKRIMPTQLKKMEESQQEATEKEVERILGFLQSYHNENPELPISYYEFVIDPQSFSRTVENIFHISFLIRDGLAKIYLDQNKLPCIAPVPREEAEAAASSSRQQCVISISQSSWRELIQAFDITAAMISSSPSHRNSI